MSIKHIIAVTDDRTGESGEDADVRTDTHTIWGLKLEGEMSAKSRDEFANAIAPFLVHFRREKGKVPPELKVILQDAEVIGSTSAPKAKAPSGKTKMMGSDTHPEVFDVPREHSKEENDRLRAWCVLHDVDRGTGRAPALLWVAYERDDPAVWNDYWAARNVS